MKRENNIFLQDREVERIQYQKKGEAAAAFYS